MESLGFPIHSIVSYANNDSFTSFFPIWVPFTSSSYLIAGVRTSSTVLKKSGDSEHPCLTTDLKGNVFSFSL